MQTYSHVLIAGALVRPLRHFADQGRQLPPLRAGALMIGSFAPDVLLTLLTILLALLDAINGNFSADPETFFTGRSLVGRLFQDWFFNNGWVITLQNIFHSPVLIVLYGLTGWLLWRYRRLAGGVWLFWFAVACMLHTLIDIPLHYDDGPLLLFPFNWSVRFLSPVSYWDPSRYGRQFFIFEHALDLLLIVLLLVWYLYC